MNKIDGRPHGYTIESVPSVQSPVPSHARVRSAASVRNGSKGDTIRAKRKRKQKPKIDSIPCQKTKAENRQHTMPTSTITNGVFAKSKNKRSSSPLSKVVIRRSVLDESDPWSSPPPSPLSAEHGKFEAKSPGAHSLQESRCET